MSGPFSVHAPGRARRTERWRRPPIPSSMALWFLVKIGIASIIGGRSANASSEEQIRGRSLDPAQGGRSAPARARRIRVRHPPARHAACRVSAQPACACPHSINHRAARHERPRVHRRGPAWHAADPHRVARDRHQVAGLAAAGDRQGAVCRRGDRRLRRAEPRRGGRPRRVGDGRLRRARRGCRRRRGTAARRRRLSTNTGATISSATVSSKEAISRRRPGPPRSSSSASIG